MSSAETVRHIDFLFRCIVNGHGHLATNDKQSIVGDGQRQAHHDGSARNVACVFEDSIQASAGVAQ